MNGDKTYLWIGIWVLGSTLSYEPKCEEKWQVINMIWKKNPKTDQLKEGLLCNHSHFQKVLKTNFGIWTYMLKGYSSFYSCAKKELYNPRRN